jgi:hypothetical protein
MSEFQKKFKALLFVKNQGIGVIIDNNKLHIITAENGVTHQSSLSTNSILIKAADLTEEIPAITGAQYAILSKYSSIGGGYHILATFTNTSSLGKALHSGVGRHSDEGSDSKIIAIIHFGDEPWVKKPEEIKFEQTFSIQIDS